MESVEALEEPAAEGALEAREGVAAVDEVARADVGVDGFTGGMDGQGIDVVAEDFGAEVLSCGQPGHARQMFQGQTVLDPLECLLNSPPGVIERPEFASGVGVEVKERGYEDAHLVAEHLANQAHFTRRDGNFVVQRILFAGSWQPDDLLGQSGLAEGLNGAEIEAVHSHAEVPPALQQGGEEPVGWVTAVEHQNVLGTELVEMFEEHLALADVRRIQRGSQGHFDPGQIQCEANGVDHVANKWPAVTGLAEQGQTQDRGIAGDDPQPVSEGKAELRIDQGEEVIVEKLEGGGRHLLPRFGKGLCGDFSQQVGAVRQIGEERVEFRLHFRRVSAEQAGDQAGKTEEARSRESFRRKTRIKEKSLGNKILGKRVNDVDIKIAAYKLLHPYQGDTYFALCSPGAQPGSRSAPEFMPIAC